MIHQRNIPSLESAVVSDAWGRGASISAATIWWAIVPMIFRSGDMQGNYPSSIGRCVDRMERDAASIIATVDIPLDLLVGNVKMANAELRKLQINIRKAPIVFPRRLLLSCAAPCW